MRTRAPGLGIVEQLQHPFALGEDGLRVLHDGVRGQAAIFFGRFIEPRVTVMRMPERVRLFDLDVDGVLQARREEIMMIGRRGAAREQELGQREPRRQAQMLRLQPRPDRIERGQPVKQPRLMAAGWARVRVW